VELFAGGWVKDEGVLTFKVHGVEVGRDHRPTMYHTIRDKDLGGHRLSVVQDFLVRGPSRLIGLARGCREVR